MGRRCDRRAANALAIFDHYVVARCQRLGRGRGYSKTVDLTGIALEVLLAQVMADSVS